MDIRIGHGVDVHRLEENYPLYIGGLKIDSEKGAVGHSDADVLLHAICDALLGALSLRDIGYHFSDKDPAYKGIDSKLLLSEVYKKIQSKGYTVNNIDSTVILEIPKLSPYIHKIEKVIADLLSVDVEKVSVKATTHEKVDSFGRNESIKAYAVCLLQKH